MAPESLIGSVVDTGLESRCGRYLFLVHTYAMTQTQIRGIMTTEKYSWFAPHKNIYKKIKKSNEEYVKVDM